MTNAALERVAEPQASGQPVRLHLVSTVPVGPTGLQRRLKRALDVTVSLAALVLFSPVLVLTGILIMIESPGPALFKQTRLGRDGRRFSFYKFRTMLVDNDPAIHQAYVQQLITQCSDSLKGQGGSYKLEHDPRVTRVGRVLRKTSMDELPQLLNVLAGDMSLVGPRPPLPYEAALYSDRAWERLACLPGMTGLWQVSGRCETTFEQMVELDIEYIRRWSLGLDLSILFRTISVVLGRKGAW